MSLYSALAAGVSGLGANSNAMAAIADNITNVNTPGYKGTEVRFSTLVSGGTGNNYSAGGVTARPQALISKQGLLQASAGETDLAIDGAGFFVVRNADTSEASISLTRSGSFLRDSNGYLRNDAGLYLQGWALDADGEYLTGNSINDLQTIRLGDLNGTAEATTRIGMRANLSSQQAQYAGVYAAGDMADGTVTPHLTETVDVYDAQGGVHQVTVAFLKTATNVWQVEVYGVPAETTAGTTPLATGTVHFNPNGSLDRTTSTGTIFNPVNVSWTNGAGSDPIALNLGDDGLFNGLRQIGGASKVDSADVNGALLGSVESVQVSKEGIVSAVFGNGTIRAMYRVPVATVQNPDGMQRLAGNAYALTGESGDMSVSLPGEGGSGFIAPKALEGSNVDLAEQFTRMIVTQRAYGAAGKIITTADEMLQELSQLKR